MATKQIDDYSAAASVNATDKILIMVGTVYKYMTHSQIDHTLIANIGSHTHAQISTHVSGTLAQHAATTSSQLAGVISDETGSGALVFATSPTLVTPALGTPASGVLTNCTGSPTLSALTVSGATNAASTITISNGIDTHGFINSPANLYINIDSGNGGPSNLFQLAVNRAAATGGTVLLTVQDSGAVSFPTYGAGTLVTDGSGNITASSDERLKNILNNYSKGLEAVLNITPILYKWNKESGLEPDSIYLGFSAQNVKENIPEAVFQNKDGYYTLNDKGILGALVNSVKELNQKVEILEAKI